MKESLEDYVSLNAPKNRKKFPFRIEYFEKITFITPKNYQRNDARKFR